MKEVKEYKCSVSLGISGLEKVLVRKIGTRRRASAYYSKN